MCGCGVVCVYWKILSQVIRKFLSYVMLVHILIFALSLVRVMECCTNGALTCTFTSNSSHPAIKNISKGVLQPLWLPHI